MTTTDLARETPRHASPTSPGTWSRIQRTSSGLRPSWKALGAYLIYQTMAFAIWVVPILSVFGREPLGKVLMDSRYYQWALEWTPWAVSHGVNPLYASSVFATTGVSMAWSAFVGGCLFGFSAYVSSNVNGGFMNLVLVFPIPLLVYLAIRNVEGSLGPVAFVAGSTALLVGLFSISTELFGTATLFGAVAFLGALAFATELRARLVRTGGLVLLAGAIAALVLLPYIVAIFSHAPDKLV